MRRRSSKTSELIIDRGRGPELVGTRVTVYRVMDYLRHDCSASEIAAELSLTAEQVEAALEYIETHRDDVEVEYSNIMRRVNQPNPPEIESKVQSADDLRQQIQARRAAKGDHDRPVRQ